MPAWWQGTELQKPLPSSLCSLDVVVCRQGEQHSPHSKSIPSELAFETLTQLEEANQTTWDGVIFLGARLLARETFKAAQGESGNHTAD